MNKFISKFMILIASAGAIVTTRGVSNEVKDVHAKEKYSYVSLGDSMTTGFGFDDYYVDDDPDAKVKNVDYKSENGCKNVRGFLNVSEKSYPGLIGKYLTETYPEKDVEVLQLATNAARIDDIYFQITGREETDEFYKYIFDTNGKNEKWNSIFGERARDKGFTVETDNNKAVTEVYKNALVNADLVTISAGFNNFGCFISGKLEQIIESNSLPFSYKFGGADTLKAFVERIGLNLNVEELYSKIVEIINNVAGIDITGYEDIELDFGTLHVKRFVEILALATVSYLYYMNETTKLILNLNPDVELVVVGMCNPIRGTKVKVGTTVINAEEIIGAIFKICNLYSAIATEKANSYKYVEVDDLDVKLHIDDMKAKTMDESQIKRAYSGVYDLLDQFGLSSMLPTFAQAKAQIENGVNESIGQPGAFKFVNYLDKKDAEAYQQRWKITSAALAAFGVYADAIASNVNDALEQYYLGIDYFISTFTRAANVEAIDLESFLALDNVNQEVLDSGKLDGLLNIYIRILLGNGMWNHPNEEGHAVLANAIIDTLKSDKTAREVGLETLKSYAKEIIEEAKPILKELGCMIGEKITEVIGSVVDLEMVKEKLGELKPLIEKVITTLKIFAPVFEYLGTKFKLTNIINDLIDNVNKLVDVFVDVRTTVASTHGILSIVYDHFVIFKGFAEGTKYLVDTLESITDLSNALVDIINRI